MRPGNEQPVRTPADWQIRRKQILAGMAEAMGDLPDRTNLGIPTVEVVEEVKEPKFTRLTLKIAVDTGDSVPAYLYLPDGPAGRHSAAGGAWPCIRRRRSARKRSMARTKSIPISATAANWPSGATSCWLPIIPRFGDYPCDFSDTAVCLGIDPGRFQSHALHRLAGLARRRRCRADRRDRPFAGGAQLDVSGRLRRTGQGHGLELRLDAVSRLHSRQV